MFLHFYSFITLCFLFQLLSLLPNCVWFLFLLVELLQDAKSQEDIRTKPLSDIDKLSRAVSQVQEMLSNVTQYVQDVVVSTFLESIDLLLFIRHSFQFYSCRYKETVLNIPLHN